MYHKKIDSVAGERSKNYDPHATLKHCSYKTTQKISSTLQGSIYKGLCLKTNKDVIIKRANVQMCRLGMGNSKGKFYKVKEDIVKEAAIMTYLKKKSKADGIFLNCFALIEDERNYFLVQENGGECLLNHANKWHSLIKDKKLKIAEWNKHVKALFKQMAGITYWLNEICFCCHFDISLENILVKGCELKDGVFVKHGKVSFCDFGLAEIFKQKNFKCKKFVGKKNYQSPKNYAKKAYDAKKNDIYCLGICLFSMAFGHPPYSAPDYSCHFFTNIYNGNIRALCERFWDSRFASDDLLNLLSHIITPDHSRFDINQLLEHSYLN